MSVAGCQSERAPGDAARALAPVRVRGGARVRTVAKDGETRLADLGEGGGYRLRFPTTHARHVEAVQINTGGGVAGGDVVRFAAEAAAGADLVWSTQAAERIYRSSGLDARIEVTLSAGAGARLDWLPQETIVYSGARLRRRIEAEVAPDAALLMAETVVFGRVASSEVPGPGLHVDDWRIRRAGRLVFAESLRLDGDVSRLLARPAVAAGARAAALILFVAPDAEDRLQVVRTALDGVRCDCGSSAWNGILAARLLGADPAHVRAAVAAAVATLTRRPLPRVWQT